MQSTKTYRKLENFVNFPKLTKIKNVKKWQK